MDDNGPWWSKVRRNIPYRKKFLRSLSIIFCATSLGFFYGNLGPALPDLQLLTGQGLDVISWLFTATNAGSLFGTLICGQFVDRVGPQLVLFVSLTIASVLTAVFIYIPSFTVMLIVRVFTGMFIGGVDLAGIASVTEIWHAESRPYIHCLQVMLSVGGILTPLVEEPFLAPRTKKIVNASSISRHPIPNFNSALEYNGTVYSKHVNYTDILPAYNFIENKTMYLNDINYSNITDGAKVTYILDDTIIDTREKNNTTIKNELVGETRIQYAFIIFAAIGLVAALILLTFIISDFNARTLPKDKTQTKHKNKETDSAKRMKYSIPNGIKIVLLGILTVQFYLVSAMCFKCYAFMPMFYILRFDWSVSLASVAMSLFWIGRTVVGVTGIFLVTQFKQSVLIACFSTIYLISAVCLTISGIYNINSLAWASAASLGVGFSILFPSLFALTEENITHVSGRLASIFMASLVSGGMLDPLYTGYLMDRISSMWFAYLLSFQSATFLFLFAVIKGLIRRYGQRQSTGIEIEIEPMK